MIQRYTATFDGRHFNPMGPVDVEPGSVVELIVVPKSVSPHPDAVTRPLTADELAAWEKLTAELQSVPPDPPTFEEYLRENRGEP